MTVTCDYWSEAKKPADINQKAFWWLSDMAEHRSIVAYVRHDTVIMSSWLHHHVKGKENVLENVYFCTNHHFLNSNQSNEKIYLQLGKFVKTCIHSYSKYSKVNVAILWYCKGLHSVFIICDCGKTMLCEGDFACSSNPPSIHDPPQLLSRPFFVRT